ncbi:magnesium/cobalt transporter CorA [Methanococcoides methylutens]|uniref:Magnesium transport protein CorA n=1 Tax=Methanococcoides methylutens MM1 TaxID=1434104 RepID=A0A0E3X0C9_METMT|nr:magnesium/cobalt transporter CorA [Methanococcoides methylutens]AKB85179.1 Magnesium and cobalt transport protein CorA [Methanococcoides methylutens MM1]
MGKIVNIGSRKAGVAPGTLIHIGKKHLTEPEITIIDYDADHFQEIIAENIEETYPFRDSRNVSWINLCGVHQVEMVEKIGMHFGIHPLVLEDIVHTDQRPKVEFFDPYIYIVLKMLTYDKDKEELTSEQVSILLGDNFVISFQEVLGDTFDPVRDRLRLSKGRIRKQGPDYLAYALLDSIIDNYFVMLEKIGEDIEALDDELLEDPTPKTVEHIHRLKKEIIFLRRYIWPLREVVSTMQREESPFIKESTAIFLKDVYDHIIQVMDTIESYRDVLSTMLDLYLSTTSNKMNEIMKVLTIIATIFIPLTFIAGIYGMNFEHMPELGWQWGYPAVWVIMSAVAIGMLAYFKKLKWL